MTRMAFCMWPFATNCNSQRLVFHACLFQLQIKGMSYFRIEHIQAPISVALKALSLSFSLSGCSDLSHNPSDMLTLLERETTPLMHNDQGEAQHFCSFFFFNAFYLFTAIIEICETITSGSWNKSFGTVYCKMTTISTTNLSHTELNTNRCSIPCASGRQTVAVHKAVSDKRWIQWRKSKGRLNVWVRPKRLFWTLVSKTKRKV